MTKRSPPSSPPNRESGPARPGGDWSIPQPGDVLSYAYLWAREANAGQEEGLKDRPVVVVLAVLTRSGVTQVVVTPVTHSAPDAEQDAVELPAIVKRDLGLDRERSWLVVTEVNQFGWPGPDVRQLADGQPYYGALPDWLLHRVQQRVGSRRPRLTTRGE